MQKNQYRIFIAEKRSWYNTLGKTFCPCLNSNIYFNSKGFYHILYKGTGERRTSLVVKERMNLL